jgi:hypothetical protein
MPGLGAFMCGQPINLLSVLQDPQNEQKTNMTISPHTNGHVASDSMRAVLQGHA